MSDISPQLFSNEHVVVLYGATGGIGSALFSLLMAEGTRCCAVFRNAEKFKSIAAQVSESLYTPICFDPIKDDALSFLPLAQTSAWSETKLVTLALCAFQIAPIGSIGHLSRSAIEENLRANVTAQIQVLQSLSSLCEKDGVPFRVVFLDSGAAYRPIDGWSLYCASKAYMDLFLQVFSLETSSPVLLYDPGVVDTEMQHIIRAADSSIFSQVEKFRAFKTEKKLISPDEVAADLFHRFLSAQKWEALRASYRAP